MPPNKNSQNYHQIKFGFSKFCEETSLHDGQYLISAENVLKKFSWFLVVAVVCGLSTFFTIRNIDEYQHATTVTRF